MAEYIDREKTLSTLENTAKYYEMPNADEYTKGIHYGLIHGVDNIVDNVPIADVKERTKIKNAIAEIKELYTEWENSTDDARLESNPFGAVLNIIQRNIGEE